jgi:hypothetical protein
MSFYTSSVSGGFWTTTASWTKQGGGSGWPGDGNDPLGDAALIASGSPIYLTGSVTVGLSATSSLLDAITISSRLHLMSGSRLTSKGCITVINGTSASINALVISSQSILKFDASDAAVVANQNHYALRLGNNIIQPWCALITRGQPGNWAEIISEVSGGAFPTRILSAFSNTGYFDVQGLKLTNVGRTQAGGTFATGAYPAMTVSPTASILNTLQDAWFFNCGGDVSNGVISISNVLENTQIVMRRVTTEGSTNPSRVLAWTGTPASFSLGTRSIEGCTFDGMFSVGTNQLSISESYFVVNNGTSFNTTATNITASDVFVHHINHASQQGTTYTPGIWKKVIHYRESSGSSPIGIAPPTTAWNTVYDGLIYQLSGTSALGSILSLGGNSALPTTFSVSNSLFLPRTDGGSGGSIQLGSSIFLNQKFEFNTICFPTSSSTNTVAGGFTFGVAAGAGMSSSVEYIRANLFLRTQATSSTFITTFANSGIYTASTPNIGPIDYNATTNISNTNMYFPPTTKYPTGIPGVITNATGTHDVNLFSFGETAQFVDATRDVPRFNIMLGGTGDSGSIFNTFKNRYLVTGSITTGSTLIRDMWTWIRVGWAPQNTRLANASHLGTTIGAVQMNVVAPNLRKRYYYYSTLFT